jgi:hypothetical protein
MPLNRDAAEQQAWRSVVDYTSLLATTSSGLLKQPYKQELA